MLQKRLSALCAFIAIAVAACGGATSNGSFPNVPINAGPASNGTYAVTGPNGSKVVLSLSAGATSGKTSPNLSVTASSTAPGSDSSLQSVQRTAAQSKVHALSTGSDSSILYLSISSNIAATVSAISDLSIVLTSPPPSGPIYLAYYNGTQWVTLPQGVGATAAPSGNELTFTNINLSPALQIAAGGSLDLVVYQGVVLTTPSPPPVPEASPSAQTIYLGNTATVLITSGPNTALTASSSNTAVATVTASGNTGSGTTATFTVTAVADGTSTLTFTDFAGHSTTDTVTVVDAPFSNPATVTLGLGNQITVVVGDAPNASITAVSSDTGVATVTSPVTTDGSGNATFTITSIAGGLATITFTDPKSATGTLNVTVSAVKNGAFTNGTASWTACSYQHATQATTTYSMPLPGTGPNNSPSPEPYADQTQSPNSLATPAVAPIPFTVGTPPANVNPNEIAIEGTSAPAVLGTAVGLVGSINAGTQAYPNGETGICQQIAVPASGANSADYLSLWVFEGGSEYTYYGADQEGQILDSTGTTIKETLFSEQNCFIDPSLGWAPGASNTSGCIPQSVGGDTNGYYDWTGGGFWSERGPYDLSAYQGTTVTLYLGNWSSYHDSATKYAQFMFVGNVQMTGNPNFPTSAPASKHRIYSMSIRR